MNNDMEDFFSMRGAYIDDDSTQIGSDDLGLSPTRLSAAPQPTGDIADSPYYRYKYTPPKPPAEAPESHAVTVVVVTAVLVLLGVGWALLRFALR